MAFRFRSASVFCHENPSIRVKKHKDGIRVFPDEHHTFENIFADTSKTDLVLLYNGASTYGGHYDELTQLSIISLNSADLSSDAAVKKAALKNVQKKIDRGQKKVLNEKSVVDSNSLAGSLKPSLEESIHHLELEAARYQLKPDRSDVAGVYLPSSFCSSSQSSWVWTERHFMMHRFYDPLVAKERQKYFQWAACVHCIGRMLDPSISSEERAKIDPWFGRNATGQTKSMQRHLKSVHGITKSETFKQVAMYVQFCCSVFGLFV